MKNLLAVCLLTLIPCVAGAADTQTATDTGLAREIADRYGFAQWGEVETLEYTFNSTRPNKRKVSRAWTWYVATNTVTRRSLKAGGEAVTIALHADPATWNKDQTRVHKQFINDSYWLLIPFQLVWSDPAVTDAGEAPLPVGSGQGRKVVTQWPAEGGYTPGDAYDLFLDGDGLIRAWTFRRDGGDKGRSMTFEGYEQVGPLLLSLDHRDGSGAGGSRRFFTDVELTLRTGEQAEASAPTP